MKQTLSKFFVFPAIVFWGLFFAGLAYAQPCPVCVVAVGAGLGLSRWLGVDDSITSVWFGAILLGLVMWTVVWLKKKNWDFKFSGLLIFALYYATTFIPLYYANIVGIAFNKIFGMDKIIFGVIVGTAVLWIGLWLNSYLKARNQGKAYFPYQKVVVPVGALFLADLILYFVIKL